MIFAYMFSFILSCFRLCFVVSLSAAASRETIGPTAERSRAAKHAISPQTTREFTALREAAKTCAEVCGCRSDAREVLDHIDPLLDAREQHHGFLVVRHHALRLGDAADTRAHERPRSRIGNRASDPFAEACASPEHPARFSPRHMTIGGRQCLFTLRE